MKKFAIITCSALSLFFIAGCSSSPEKAAEKYFKDSIKSHQGLNIEQIKIENISQDKTKAVIKIDSKLNYSKELTLVKKNGKWVVE